ncbi:methyltransferase family protein [Solilutibacter silvestris]|uniref:methyltransferase family protein n=1 Tax=Solilutibacter silvestris TaxID=1645665 RepID=UPI003D3350E5
MTMTFSTPPFWLIRDAMILWGLGEFVLAVTRRATIGQSRDQGSLRLLSLVLWSSMVMAVYAGVIHWIPFPSAIVAPTAWLGLCLLVAGLLLRAWSIRVLARFFTVDVAIRDDHKLVRSGPYALLRHPSYTGALMCFYGAGLALGSWASLFLLTVPPTLAFLYRIRIEESVLSLAFPKEYPEYTRATKRLIPFVW